MAPPFEMPRYNRRGQAAWWARVDKGLMAMVTILRGQTKLIEQPMTDAEIEDVRDLLLQFKELRREAHKRIGTQYGVTKDFVSSIERLWSSIDRKLTRPHDSPRKHP